MVKVMPWYVLCPPAASGWSSVEGSPGQAAVQVAHVVVVVDRVEAWDHQL